MWWCLGVAASAFSQAQPAPGPLQPSDTSSPAATLNSLIDSCNELDQLIQAGALTAERVGESLPTQERILDCLDLSELPKDLRDTAGIESALFLKEVLDRVALPPDAEIPPVVAADPATPETSALLQQWRIPQTRIVFSRVAAGAPQGSYLLTPDTVRNASEFYRIVKDLPYRTDGRPVSPGLYDSYAAATEKKPSQQTADTSSPRGTFTLFLDSCDELYGVVYNNKDFDRNDPEFQRLGARIISCLDSSQLPEYSREYFDAEAAVCLKEVLDRMRLPNAEDIPGIESVETSDGGEATTRWQVPQSQFVISKITEGPRRGEFLFSAETVGRAPAIYQKMRSQPYRQEGRPTSPGFYEWWLSRPGSPVVARLVNWLPAGFQNRYLGMAMWQWVGLLLSIPPCLIVMLFAFRWGRGRAESANGPQLLMLWLGLVFPVITMVVPLGFKQFAFHYLSLRGNAIYVVGFGADLLFLVGVMVLLVRTSSRIAESIVALPNVSPSGLDASVIRILCRVLGIAAAVVVLLEGGRYLGFPITTLIASAGIGGLAIALSAQGLIKGLFGTVTVLLDRPYRVGDRILAKGHDGFVEEIGLRSTKIRALDGRLISIPNDAMAEAEIQNYGGGDHIRRIADLHIPLDTPLKHIEQALACIRGVLQDQADLSPDLPARVHFTEFNPDSFNIQVIYWFTPAELAASQKCAEDINLKIMKTFEEHGIQFSLPFRHTYWKHDAEQGPLDVILQDAPATMKQPQRDALQPPQDEASG